METSYLMEKPVFYVHILLAKGLLNSAITTWDLFNNTVHFFNGKISQTRNVVVAPMAPSNCAIIDRT